MVGRDACRSGRHEASGQGQAPANEGPAPPAQTARSSLVTPVCSLDSVGRAIRGGLEKGGRGSRSTLNHIWASTSLADFHAASVHPRCRVAGTAEREARAALPFALTIRGSACSRVPLRIRYPAEAGPRFGSETGGYGWDTIEASAWMREEPWQTLRQGSAMGDFSSRLPAAPWQGVGVHITSSMRPPGNACPINTIPITGTAEKPERGKDEGLGSNGSIIDG